MTKLLLIEWQDSYSMDAWQTRDSAISCSNKPMVCRTVGFIVNKQEDSIAVCHTVNEEGSVCGVMQIPKKCIISMKKIKL